ncbi:hypothetical protein [Flaviaesturariibacter aridisoli]|uniref:hypothetical protein n=1 Tax=Flaviaesturariibacter aridisoli TaxID=2545761 RepID=UPI001404E597|nr:hypothetical protein [Flaviaesturariibacter aridisoli]
MSHTLLYIEPGSGSYLLQVVIAAVMGAGFVVKTYWWRFKSFFHRKKDDEHQDSNPSK